MKPHFLLALAAAFISVSTASAQQTPRKPRIDDTIKASVYADNSFKLYINGELVAVDSIAFVPHNVVSVDVLPAYPMTIAAMGIDNADSKTGMEYANTSIGDGGFILKFSDGTVTDATWKAKKFSWGPIDGDMKNPRVQNIPVPDDWFAIEFDDSEWPNAKEFTEEEVGPKGPFFEHDFKGAKFIWSEDVKLDNLVLFRTVVKSPPDGVERPDFRGLTDVVPQGGGQRQGGGGNPFLRALDTNRDGVIDKAEIQNAATALLTLDKNKDGQISGEELRGPGRGQGGRGQGGRGQGGPDQSERAPDNRQGRGGPPRNAQSGPPRNDRGGQAGGPRGPQPGDGPRQPWILVHADEIDLDKDKIISRDEIVGEATKAFAGYDTNSDGKLSESELSVRGGSRSAMGGFLKGHSQEIDRNGGGVVTRTEAVENAERMFAKMDVNRDGKISPQEMEASRR